MLWLLAATAFADQPMLTGREAMIGNPTAPYTIVEYADWLCPHCAHAWERLEPFVAANPDVRVVIKAFPLGLECNPTLTVSNPTRCTLAYGAVCANVQGRFAEYATWAYGQQAALWGADDTMLLDAAPSLGLDEERLRKCLSDPATHTAVVTDAGEGNRLEVKGTPTFYVRSALTGTWQQTEGGVDGAIGAILALRNQHPLPAEAP